MKIKYTILRYNMTTTWRILAGLFFTVPLFFLLCRLLNNTWLIVGLLYAGLLWVNYGWIFKKTKEEYRCHSEKIQTSCSTKAIIARIKSNNRLTIHDSGIGVDQSADDKINFWLIQFGVHRQGNFPGVAVIRNRIVLNAVSSFLKDRKQWQRLKVHVD